jgi:hypothetical protein
MVMVSEVTRSSGPWLVRAVKLPLKAKPLELEDELELELEELELDELELDELLLEELLDELDEVELVLRFLPPPLPQAVRLREAMTQDNNRTREGLAWESDLEMGMWTFQC